MKMKKFREFKEIATNVGLVLKKYWFYKQNLNTYLTTKEFSEENFQKIEKDLALNLEWKTYIEEFGKDNTQEEARTAFIKLLMIESLYNNHELFKKLKTKYPHFDLPKECREVVFKRSFNELVKTVNYQELEKNIQFLNDTKINLVVLEKAFLTSDTTLYQYISPLVNLNEDDKEIKKFLFLMIAKNGERLIDSSFAQEIKKHINTEDLKNLFSKDFNYYMNKKVAKNIDTFFDIDILHELINQEEINKELFFYSFSKSKKEFKHTLTKIDKTKDYSHIIKVYLGLKFKEIDIKQKIIILNEEGLLTDKIWDEIIKKENTELLNILFLQREKLLPYLGEEKTSKVMSEYKQCLIDKPYDKDLVKDFLEHYPYQLEKEELIQFINKRYSYISILEINNKKTDSTFEKENKKEFQLLNSLFDKYSQYMLEKETICEITNKTRNDLFNKHYLLKLSEKIKDAKIWDELIVKENKTILKIIFNNIENFKNLTQENREKVFKEYKEVVLNYSFESEEIINFIEKYPYNLKLEEIINLMEKSNKYLKAVSSLEKEATDLIQEKYNEQLTVENMLAPNDYEDLNILQEQRKVIDICFNKFPQYLNDKETVLLVAKNTINDTFLSVYLNKYFELNKDENLKIEVVKNLVILDNTSFGNTVQWIVENNLLHEVFPMNEYKEAERNLLTNKAWNGWVPLLIEKFDIKPDGLIKQTVASFISNDELFKFILNNYELKPKTQQLLCNSVFAIDAVELAEELFKKEIAPNDYYEEKFKSSPTHAGNILLKAKLKEKLENKFDSIDEENKTKKVKKI